MKLLVSPIITFNKPYLGKASIFSTIPLHWSSRWISWAIDIIYRPAVATPWVHCIFIGYVSIYHTDLFSIVNNRNTFFKIKTFFKRWLNLRGYFQYYPIFIKTLKIVSTNFFVNKLASNNFVHFYEDITMLKLPSEIQPSLLAFLFKHQQFDKFERKKSREIAAE